MESGYNTVGAFTQGSHQAEIQLLTRAAVLLEAQLNKDPLPAPSGCWQNSCPRACRTDTPLFLLFVAGEAVHSSGGALALSLGPLTTWQFTRLAGQPLSSLTLFYKYYNFFHHFGENNIGSIIVS